MTDAHRTEAIVRRRYAASVTATVWVTKIARDALQKTADVQ
jgi:hypothetical protein